MLDTFLQNLTLPALPPAEALIACALTAVAASFVLAGSFGAFFAIASEFLSIRAKRAFYARAARQIAQMTLAAGVLAAMFCGGAAAWFAKGERALLAPPYILPLALTGVAILVALGLLALYIRIRPDKGYAGKDHLIVGLAAGVWAAFSLFCCTGVARRLLHSPPEFDLTLPWAAQLTLFFSIPADSFFWPLLLESVPLGFAFAAAFACVWLLLMRERQDYGRDYYTFALPYCAKWAFGFTLPAVLAGAFVFYESRELMLPELSQEPSLLLDGLSAALPLLACLLWLFVARSAHPMRRKISVVLALLFLLIGFAGQVLMLNKIIPSP
ncbi:membrane hypothetical protein [uncultured delta proteobacterium]|uniref:Uncharacterized protein n=1 Tax=uncultured delta proteobacterium TaxID=34034 RepID=A0A212IV07_9DELT|nr:membrane hypothetical protein [uncultured delta proteobacterium]